jgi:hypothetical protein
MGEMVSQMMIVNLIDRNIAHVKSYDDGLEKGRASKKIVYVRNQQDFQGITVFTDECLKAVDQIRSRFKVAWLMEPRAYSPQVYKTLIDLIDRFHLVLTFDSQLLYHYPNVCARVPASGIFLDSNSIFTQASKSKICSMIYSNKKMLPGHRLRHEVVHYIASKGFEVELFGTGTGSYLECKSQSLNDYCFSISIENSVDDFYITEKIYDCFAARTVPIYWGSNTVLDDFNPTGILKFNTLDELDDILSSLSYDLYDMKRKAIEENYYLALKHYSVDDHIADILSKSFKQ